MSATITPLPSRSGESEVTPERQNRTSHSLEPGPARDSFIAETATKIEGLQAAVERLTRGFEGLTNKVAKLEDACALEDRWYAFHQGEKRAKESKLDETVRYCRDLKARLDRIEAWGSGDYHAYSSFEAVSRKLAEHERLLDDRAKRKNVLRACLFSAMLIASVAIVALSMFLPTNG
jgi:hypothetical protein